MWTLVYIFYNYVISCWTIQYCVKKKSDCIGRNLLTLKILFLNTDTIRVTLLFSVPPDFMRASEGIWISCPYTVFSLACESNDLWVHATLWESAKSDFSTSFTIQLFLNLASKLCIFLYFPSLSLKHWTQIVWLYFIYERKWNK